jgi:glycerol-3-phosphate dehydrogenase
MTASSDLPRHVDVLVIGGGATGAGLLRDLALRGLRGLLVEKGDLASGTSGRYHGLLHSGARYVARDVQAARECIAENRILRRIAPACIEDTGGVFVATPDDPEDYVTAFAACCDAAGVPCDEVVMADLFRREPALNRKIRQAFRVPDASLEPWQLVEANLADARSRGSQALAYQQVVGIERNGGFIASVSIADVRSGTVRRIEPRMVVSAAGAWAGRVAGLAGLELAMSPGKGTMLVYNQRMTDTVVNRCSLPGDGDIMVPVHTVAILGTTDLAVDDPDDYAPSRAEIESLITAGEQLFPDLRQMRLLRAYAGVRPLYAPEEIGAGPAGDRAISRAHVVVDHAARDGVSNFVSIVGGKLTTYRLMAEQTADLVCRRLGVDASCTTADEVLPGQGADRSFYWLGDRLAEHEADGGGDADLMCECEYVTRPMLERFLAERMPCSLDDVRRGTRLGMGPCQGAFCTFRAAGLMAERGSPDPPDGPLVGFLTERYRGTMPIAWGRQLQELWLSTGIYWGVLGVDALAGIGPGAEPAAAVADVPG